jgi:hypothetical protein
MKRAISLLLTTVLTSVILVAVSGGTANAAGCRWTRYYSTSMKWWAWTAFDGFWYTPVINVPSTAGYCFDVNGANVVTHSNLGYNDHHARFETWIFDGSCQCDHGSRPIINQGWSGVIYPRKREPNQIVVIFHPVLLNDMDNRACFDRRGCTLDITIGV